jgi:SAM-dependent methyltransferase
MTASTLEPQIIIGATPSVESQLTTKEEERIPFVLDVGCGECKQFNAFGIDVQRLKGVNLITDLEKCKIPFIDHSFDVVECRHCIEHVDNPEEVILEMLRVSKGKVIIECPHKESVNSHIQSHKNVFDVDWFGKIARKYDLCMRWKIDFESRFRFFTKPHNIYIELWKRR